MLHCSYRRFAESFPMKITWRRTVIGREPLHHDFCAYVDGNVSIGRVLLEYESDRKRVWSYNMAIDCKSRGVKRNLITSSRCIPMLTRKSGFKINAPCSCAISSKAIQAPMLRWSQP